MTRNKVPNEKRLQENDWHSLASDASGCALISAAVPLLLPVEQFGVPRPTSDIMDPEMFLELANQVTKLRMYPYFDVAHAVISCLYMREDLSSGESGFEETSYS